MKIIYTSIEFDKSILEFSKTIFTSFYSKVYCDHITLKFYNKNNSYIEREYNIDQPTTFDVIGYSFDDKCQALVCRVNEKCYNEVPHITISTEQVSPKYSNELLKTGFTKIDSVRFTGIIRNKIF